MKRFAEGDAAGRCSKIEFKLLGGAGNVIAAASPAKRVAAKLHGGTAFALAANKSARAGADATRRQKFKDLRAANAALEAARARVSWHGSGRGGVGGRGGRGGG